MNVEEHFASFNFSFESQVVAEIRRHLYRVQALSFDHSCRRVLGCPVHSVLRQLYTDSQP